MTTQFRFVFGSNIFDLAANGWHVTAEFAPPAMRYTPVIATGSPSADYAGGDLVEEFISDVTFNLPLIYKGDSPEAARRALESFLRRGVKAKTLQLQSRQDRAFSMTPLWGQWGAWEKYEIIHAGSLQFDGRMWEGYNGVFADVALTCKPAVLGQPQALADAKGNVTEDFGSDGLSDGVIIANDDASQMLLSVDSVDVTEGTIIIAWKRGAETLPTVAYFFNLNDGIRLEYADGSGYGLETYDAEGQEWGGGTLPAEGETVIIHLTYIDGGAFRVYINGEWLNGLAYSAGSADITKIGTDSSGANGTGGTYRMFAVYDTVMTDAEIAADYADIAAALDAGPSPSPIPYLLTRNGDHVFDNCRDDSGSLGTPHYNYGWLAGIPGTLPAALELRLLPSVTGNAMQRVALSLVDYDTTFDPLEETRLYHDLSGSSDTSSSGGAYLSTTVDTTFTLRVSTTQDDAAYQILAGRDVCIYSRLQSGSTGNFQIKLAVIVGSTSISRAKNVANSTGFKLVRTPFLSVPRRTAPAIADEAEANIQLYAGRSSGSGTALFDYGVVMARPLVEVDLNGLGSVGVAVYEDTANYYALSGTAWAPLPRAGDVLRPRPHRYNLLMMVMGDEGVDPLTSWTITASPTITPRWSVL